MHHARRITVTQPNHKQPSYTKELGPETFIFPVIFIGFFALFAFQMGLANTLNTIMNTAYRLLFPDCFPNSALSRWPITFCSR